ncbi:hypothetical protein [Pseudodesulfovibrio pelocollis]|uniref:hypothetical protein n=1 Tax=Pseudodesulfovibrio pelocollis TaxID=3051432 RepID=UPI00255B3387|nr:hypothetical protein [Pseudodesulfovibrio sp. SB368]
MSHEDFQTLLGSLANLGPEQKVAACRAMDVVPLAYTKTSKNFKTGDVSRRTLLASSELVFDGPFQNVITNLTKALNSIEFVQKGFFKNRFRLTDSKLAALVDPQTMQEEGLISHLNAVIEQFNKELSGASDGAKTDFVKRREQAKKKSGPKQSAGPQKGEKNAQKEPEAKEPQKAGKAKAKTKPKKEASPALEKEMDEAKAKDVLIKAITDITGSEPKKNLKIETLQKMLRDLQEKDGETKAA